MLSFGSVEQVLAYNYVQSNPCLVNNKIKELPTDFSGGLIVGKIDESIKNLLGNSLKSKPMPDVEVKVQNLIGSKKSDFYGETDANGYYEIKVPVGKYLVTLVDSNFYFGEPSNNKPIEVRENNCAVKDFYVVNDSRIEGKAIDYLGNPVTDISIDIIPVGIDRTDENFDYELSQTLNKGHFRFTGLSPGLYQISLNYAEKPDEDAPYPTFFYPYTKNREEAQIIEIDYGMKITNLVFQFPPKLKKRKITGRVFWKDGIPAEHIKIDLIDVLFNEKIFGFDGTSTNKKGAFELEWFENRKYKLTAFKVRKLMNQRTIVFLKETGEFTLDKNTKYFKIILDDINPEGKLTN